MIGRSYEASKNFDYGYLLGLAKSVREIAKRLTAPEIREIVREELPAALQTVIVKMDDLDKRLRR